jgi:hypothetical protein
MESSALALAKSHMLRSFPYSRGNPATRVAEPNRRASMANEARLDIQQQILANQRQILANQKRLERNQKKLDRILVNQARIVANQKQILGQLAAKK